MDNNFLNQLLTGKDGETHDIGRHSWMWSMIAIFAGGTWNAMHGAIIDLVQMANAIGVIVAAHGGALWAKAKTEPEKKE